MNLNEKSKEIHIANRKWWYDPETNERLDNLNKGQFLMLVISEIAEAMEGERKNLKDDHLPHRKMAEVEMADAAIRLLDYAAGFHHGQELNRRTTSPLIDSLPDNKSEFLLTICGEIYAIYELGNMNGVGDELPVILIFSSIQLIETYCKKFGYDLWAAVDEKLAYNITRADHQKEARELANGKKW